MQKKNKEKNFELFFSGYIYHKKLHFQVNWLVFILYKNMFLKTSHFHLELSSKTCLQTFMVALIIYS